MCNSLLKSIFDRELARIRHHHNVRICQTECNSKSNLIKSARYCALCHSRNGEKPYLHILSLLIRCKYSYLSCVEV